MGNIIFIVWRESVEGLLVIGILYAWLNQREEAALGKRFLFGGILAGIGMALALGWGMLKVQSELAGAALDYFQTAIMLVAAVLIVQMVFWMRKNGRTLKRDLEAGMAHAAGNANWWGMALLAAFAVGREGAETVVFLYGTGLAQTGMAQLQFVVASSAGFALALLTFWILSRSSHFMPWKVFFRFSEIVLLLLGGALLVDGADRLIGMGLIPALVDPVWSSTFLLDDSSRIGGLVAAITGYRAQPALSLLLIYAGYWLTMWSLFCWTAAPKKAA